MNRRTVNTECEVCDRLDDCSHLDICVRGSEGVWLCPACQIELAGFVQTLLRVKGQVKKETYKKAKKGEQNETRL